MNLPVPGAAGSEIVTQESLLLGAAERIGRVREGRLALHVHLSRLRPQNRQEGHLRIAMRMLEPMVNAYRGQMFLLSNSDIVFLLKDPNLTDVENMVFKLRALFSKDPLTFVDTGDGRDNFCTWFELEGNDYDAFLAMARDAAQAARAKAREGKEAAALAPIDPKSLGEIMARVASMDVTPVIRRQSAIIIHQTNATVLFQEFFVAMAELQKALAPGVNLLGNRWLFQHLSQALDLKVLDALRRVDLRVRPQAFSLNLNLSTVLSPAFDAFAEGEAAGTGIFVELQILDVLADSRAFYAARQRLREKKRFLAIDGLNELTLQFMDVSQFEADLYKITWSPDMRDAEHAQQVARHLGTVGGDKILLARCDSEAAINWGLERGVQRFQGRYVDAMLAAYVMQFCDKAQACSLPQCLTRRAVIGGSLREQCGLPDMLDSSPVIKAPRAPASREGAA
jgi:hypothetical protein